MVTPSLMISNSALCQKLVGGRQDPLLVVTVEVSQYIRITKVSQSIGVFPMSLAPSDGKITLAIGKVISIVLSKQVEISLTGRSEWTVNDGKGKQWVIAFRDPRDADKALAALGILYAVNDAGEAAFYDAKKPEEGAKAISLADTVKMNYRCFSVSEFPVVDRLVANRDAFNAKLRARKLPKALAEKMVGMAPGVTRVIFLPEVGDSQWPDGAFVFVVEVLRAKYGDAEQQESDGEDDEESIAPASVPQSTAAQREEAPVVEEREPEPAEDDEAPAEISEEDRAAQEKAERIRRMQRLGAVAGPIVPTLPKAAPKPVVKQEEPEPEPVVEEPVKMVQPKPEEKKVVQPKPEVKKVMPPKPEPRKIAPPPEVTVSHLEERVEHLAKSVEKRLDAMLKPRGQIDVEAVISGITSLAVQARTQQTEIEQLTKILEDVKSKNAGNTFAARQMDGARHELEEHQRRAALLDKKVKDGNRKLRELEKAMLDASKRAKDQGGRMIKALMSNVFEDMTTAFEEEGRDTGQEVRDQLYELLRKHSFSMMKQVEAQGLI